MRLICPNCGAQYEVEPSVIPKAGRDVQCSNCGHTWFERPGRADEELAEEIGAVMQVEESAEIATEPPPPAPQRRKLDPEVASLLREEAKREAAARRSGGASLETQPDLGLETRPRRLSRPEADGEDKMDRPEAPAGAVTPVDTLTSTEPAAAARPEAESTQRRGAQLPDIDEVDNAIGENGERVIQRAAVDELLKPGPTTEQRWRRGFRLGFGLTVLLVVAAVLTYRFAPDIAARLPQSEPYLIAYIDWVNTLRMTVDSVLVSTGARIGELISGLTG